MRLLDHKKAKAYYKNTTLPKSLSRREKENEVESPFTKSNMATSLLLRIGLAFVFIYAAVMSFIHPLEWVGYLPSMISGEDLRLTLLKAFSVGQIILALWLLSGFFTRFAAILTAVTLLGITVADFSIFAITFRDVGLFFAALALAALEVKSNKPSDTATAPKSPISQPPASPDEHPASSPPSR